MNATKLTPRSILIHALLLAVFVTVIGSAIGLSGHTGLISLAELKTLLVHLIVLERTAPLGFAVCFFAAYVFVTALCIPLEIPFALMAGALFGLVEGVIISSFASVFGATLAFLGARFLFRDFLFKCFPGTIAKINHGIDSDGIFYLVNLRFIPIMPYSLVNVLMGLTSIKTIVFFTVSQAAMIFATIAFVAAGTQLYTIETYRDIMSPTLICLFGALAVLPWAFKGIARLIRRR